MIPRIEALYRQIAESMQAAIPEEWATAKFEAIFYLDCSTYEAEYTRKADGVSRSFQPADEGDRAFRQLREQFEQAGKRLWGRACFELRSDGTFNMQWSYDDCDENGDARFDEEEEIRRHEARHRRLTAIPNRNHRP